MHKVDMKSIQGERPAATAGMRHVALFVENLEQVLDFYVGLLGMKVEWQPDPDNYYLTSGSDNLALHRREGDKKNVLESAQRLDHIGFIIDAIDQVDEWYAFFNQNNVTMRSVVKTHRDGARSFYCEDPAGTIVQIIYHPPISAN
jgi:catechol 2,3-dioxygenase-like lactoylglutathione lyase family enzyme